MMVIMEQQDPSRIDLYIRQAIESFHQRDYTNAERTLREAISIAPHAIEPRYHLANLLEIDNRFEELVSTLEPIKNDPRIGPEYRWFLFQTRWNTGDTHAAAQIAQEIANQSNLNKKRKKSLMDFSRQTGNWRLFRSLTKQFGDRKDRREAGLIAPIHSFLRLLPPQWRRGLIRSLSRYFLTRNRWRITRVLLTAARFSDPHWPEWPRSLGQIERAVRDCYDPEYMREKRWYDAALQLDPTDEEAFHGLCLTLNDMGHWDALLKLVESKLKGDPSLFFHQIQAVCYCNLDRDQIADKHYQQLEERMDTKHPRFCRGLIALRNQQWEQAAALFHYQTKERSLQVLGDFFFAAAQRLTSCDSPAMIDGQTILNALQIPDEESSLRLPPASHDEPCVLCGRRGERIPLWRDTTSGWIRVRCPSCSLISVSPIPSAKEISALYNQPGSEDKSLSIRCRRNVDDLDGADEKACRQNPLFLSITQWGDDFCWEDFKHALGKEKKYLDIGCAAGLAVRIFEKCGWRTEGIDIDQKAISFGRSKGLNLRIGSIDSLQALNNRYHVITLIDVIEHVGDPTELVQKIYQLVAPGGLFVVKTPSADSLPHHFLGNRWLEASEHLHFFSRTTLSRLLEDVGFHIQAFKQTMEAPTAYLHSKEWKERFFPELFEEWIERLRVGDTIFALAKKPVE